MGIAATLSAPAGVQITTSGGAALRAAAQNANASITASGVTTISNVPASANGIHAQVAGAAGNAGIVFSGANAVTMETSGDNGVFIQNAGSGSSQITVSSGSSLSITNMANTGSDRDGMEINSTGSGNASIVHNGQGIITTANGSGMFIRAANGGNIVAEAGAGVSFVVNKPGAASNNAGIRTSNTVGGTTTINNEASMQVSGTNAHGIFVQGVTGTTRITNAGTMAVGGVGGFGIRASASGAGDVRVANSGAITTTGPSGHAIYLTSQGGNISVVNDGALVVGSPGAIDGSRGIYINANVVGNIAVSGRGDITVIGNAATPRGAGIILNTTNGNVDVNYSGTLISSGNGAAGIRVNAIAGNVGVIYTGDRIETFNQDAIGIYASAQSATGTVDIDARGTIITHSDNGGGDGSGSGAFGLEAISYGGDVNLAYGGPLIDVNGSGAAILAANAYFTGTGLGTIFVDNTGTLIARGNQQQGIRTFSTTGTQTILNDGAIQTFGATNSQGIYALTNGAAPIVIDNGGAIATVGNNSSGIDAVSQGASVAVSNRNAITAGWGSSAGVLLGGTVQALTDSSSIEALSDVAISTDSAGFAGAVHIDNTGVMTGGLTASTSLVDIANSGTWNLRNFADTDGDQVRDRLAVAVSQLGSSGANAVTNTGTIALLTHDGTATTLDTTGQYLPFGNPNNTMALASPAQGQLLGATTFTNSGTINLQANPSAGDVLVITGGQTPGTDGGGLFVASGGILLLDTVLDDGGADSTSDILVLDSTQLGSGPTGIAVKNALRMGDLTIEDGIPVVEVLNAPASAAGVFALAVPAVAGPYDYTLFQGGDAANGGDPADGNWYLRSTLSPGPPPVPHYRPEVSLAAANPGLGILYGRSLLDTLHERIGDRRPLPGEIEIGEQQEDEDEKARGVWGRVIGQVGHHHGDPIGIYGTGPSFDYSLGALQAGVDLYYHESEDDDGDDRDTEDDDGSTDTAGIYGAIGMASAGVEHHLLGIGDFAGGNASLNAYTLGGYWTHYGPDNWYLDAVLQGTIYDFTIDSRRGLRSASTSGVGIAASLETGYPIGLGEGWILEPQAQVIFQSIGINGFNDGGADIRYSDTQSLTGRIGVRLARTWFEDDDPEEDFPRTVWARANLWNEFLAQPVTEFSSATGPVPFATDLRDTWLELGVGADLQLNKDTSFYGAVNYQTSLDGQSNGFNAKIGLRVKW